MISALLTVAPLVLAPAVQTDTADYWQQAIQYTITARLDEPSGVLAGRQRVVYHNNSPHALDEFYFHLYLNAFRPGSRWADRDSIEARFRFNHLQDPDFAFNHVRNVRIAGRPATPTYPFAPDSTIVRFALPQPLPPGDSLIIEMDWDARPSTVPRRQGRQGRRFDFAQWYPRVVAYDRYGWEAHPLYPAGEFYGDFGTFDVTLDVADDQVIGATGVPVEGDPGWRRARANPAVPVTYEREWYAQHPSPNSGEGPSGPGCATAVVAAGRKCVRFYAADVHHFAMSLNPDYVYEEGRFGDAIVRVLYQPQDSETWGKGVAVGRTEEALRWLNELFGPYPWPQITNVHRIEGGGTEFPMMVMNGGASLGLILHEGGHNYVMGILANNEWKEGYLDEGFTSFQTTWYFEDHFPGFNGYSGIEAYILGLDLDRWSQPTSLVSEDYRDFATYNAMIYTRGQLFYHQLRYIVGRETMRRILREYYARWKLKHVSEEALLDVAEEVSGQDLRTLFAQWLHGTPLYDYAIGRVERRQLADSSWETTVEVNRRADGIIPVEIGERTAPDSQPVIYARASGRALRDRVTFHTAERPGKLMLDPREMTHDWNYLNNRERGVFSFAGEAFGLDTYVRTVARRDVLVSQIAPSVWYNDAAGLTVGLRWRSNYLGRYERNVVWLTRGLTGDDPATQGKVADYYLRIENPLLLRRPRTTQSLGAWQLEGRAGGRLHWEREHRRSWATPDRLITGWTAQLMVTRNRQFLDPALWEDAGTVELHRTYGWRLPSGRTGWSIDLDLGGGVAYALDGNGQRFDHQYDMEPYFRPTASAAMRRSLGDGGWRVGARAFAGAYVASNAPLRQRAVPVNGADPYETFANPLVRSVGAVLVRPNVFYHAPGNGNLRGYAPGLGGRWIAALNLELERSLLAFRRGPLRSVGVVAFGDGAVADTLAVPSPGGSGATVLADAGVGLRFDLRVGDLQFPLRAELPLWLNRPGYAQDQRTTSKAFDFRWLISVQPIF